MLDRWEDYIARRRAHITELRQRASEADVKLKRFYEAIENSVVDLDDPALKGRVAELSTIRDQARTDAERAAGAIERAGPELTEEKVKVFAAAAASVCERATAATAAIICAPSPNASR